MEFLPEFLSKKEYFNLIQNLPVGVYRATVGGEGRYVMANPAMAYMFGYKSVEELCKTPLSHIYDDPSERRVRANELIEKNNSKERKSILKEKTEHIFGVP
jgi:PAS domain-containing protein